MNVDQVSVTIFFGVIGLIIAALVVHFYVNRRYRRLLGFGLLFVMTYWLFYWAAGVGGLG